MNLALMRRGSKLSPSDVKQVRHNVALGHGLAVQAIRARWTGRNQGRSGGECRELHPGR